MTTVDVTLGRYVLIRKLAAGGMAEVFLGRLVGEANFEKQVAIKRLFEHLARDQEMLRMFQDEARLGALFDHPNIVQVLELGRAGGHWFIAMEFVDGPDLQSILRQGLRSGEFLPLEHAIRVIVQACEGLDYAHRKVDRGGRPLGLVHRDVTPTNLHVTYHGVVKILDFGIAWSRASVEGERSMRGTMGYMAPEQVRGHLVDRRADVFSLGVVLYELCTRTRLFRGNALEVMRQVCESPIQPPRQRAPDLPAPIEAIVMWALERDAAKRPRTCAELADALENEAVRLGLRASTAALGGYVRDLFNVTPVLEQADVDRAHREDLQRLLEVDLPDDF